MLYGRFLLVTYFISVVCICQSQSLSLSLPAPFPLGNHKFVLVDLFGFFFLYRIVQPLYLFLFIYLFWAALGLRCCAQALFSCGKRGLLFVAVCGLLIVVASLVAEPGL